MAHLTRVTRSTMTGILNQEFIRVARAKGLGEATVVWRYALANAIGPVMTVAGLQVGYLFGSIIVVESLFNYTGMGWVTYQALLNRDVPLIQTDGVRHRGHRHAGELRRRPGSTSPSIRASGWADPVRRFLTVKSGLGLRWSSSRDRWSRWSRRW